MNIKTFFLYFQFIYFCSILFAISNKSYANPSSFKHVSSTLPVKNVDILENSLSPQEIFLGPGDIINVDIISSSIVSNYDLIIDNTGLIIIPIIVSIFLEIWPIRSAGSFFTTSNATFFWLMVGILLSAGVKNRNKNL